MRTQRPDGHKNTYLIILFLVFGLFSFTCSSCQVYHSVGMYLGGDSSGWLLLPASGRGPVQSYTGPNLRSPTSATVSFYTAQKGALGIQVYCVDAGHPGSAQFLKSKIIVLYNDRGGQREEIDVRESAKLNVGESNDFTVIFPSFRVGNSVQPELNVRFHWSDKSVYEVRPFQ